MDELKRNCHYCVHCTGKHKDDKGIPGARCNIDNSYVIEFHMICDNFKLSRSKKLA